jgi:hypothetical protein
MNALSLVLLLLPISGIALTIWSLRARKLAWLVTGCVLSGAGTGAFLSGGLFSYPADEIKCGVCLLACAAGCGLSTLLSALFLRPVCWWPLIPAGLLGLAGGVLILGKAAVQALAYLGQGWPLVLILAGLYLVLWRWDYQHKNRPTSSNPDHSRVK